MQWKIKRWVHNSVTDFDTLEHEWPWKSRDYVAGDELTPDFNIQSLLGGTWRLHTFIAYRG